MAYLPHDHARETKLLIRLYFSDHGVWICHPYAAAGISFFQKLGMQRHLAPVMSMRDRFPGFFRSAVERDPSGQFVRSATLLQQVV